MVVIVVIMLALALPRIDWLRFRVNSDVRSVATVLTYAQQLAVSRQHDVRVTIDSVGRRLLLHEDVNSDGAVSTGERVTPYVLSDGVLFGRPGGAPGLPAPAPSGTVQQAVFRRDGSADPAGVIFVTTRRGLTDPARVRDARAVELARASGRATWYSYASGAWRRGR